MLDRPGPRRVVARGKIKVDARKALHKLRDHMLVDLHLYATEIARAAVARGATRLDVTWDVDDVVFGFGGRPFDASAVAAVLDHVLGGDGSSEDHDALRLLGIGITAALGLRPAYVDVIVATDAASAACTRVRFVPGHVEDDERAPPAVEAVARPAGLRHAGTEVHVRRRFGLETIGRAVRGDAPREVALLFDALREGPLAACAPAAARPSVVLRVDLDVPAATRAVLEVLAPAKGLLASTVFLEHGVRLATAPGVAAWSLDAAEVPLRVLVDAKRLPTNASRSELRRDAELVARTAERVPRALEVAVAALRGHVDRGAVARVGHSVEIVDGREDVHAEALGAIAAAVGVAVRAGRAVPPAARALLDLLLLRDAVGAPLTVGAVLALAARPPVFVHTGNAPEDDALAPWLRGVPWMRGGAAERVLAGVALAAADGLVAEAREGAARRARALAHPPSRPVLPRSEGHVLVEAFAVHDGPFAGLEGEIAVTRRAADFGRSASAHVFVEERRLETIALPGTSLPVEIALAWPGHVGARRTYDAVERNEALELAVVYALRVAAIAIGERLGGRDAELARLAIRAWTEATKRLGDTTPSIAALGKLADEAVWPTTDPGVLVSLAGLDAYARRTNAICVAPRGAGRAADGRPVLDETHAKVVIDLLGVPATIVPYGPWLARPPDAGLARIATDASAMPAYVPFSRPMVEGVVGIGPRTLRVHHRGVCIFDAPYAGSGLVLVEDHAAVPSPDGANALWVSPLDLAREERALLEVVVDRCERAEMDPFVVAGWLAIAKRELDDGDALAARVDALPEAARRARFARRKAELLAQPPREPVRPSGPSATITVGRADVVIASLPASAALPEWTALPVEVRFEGRPLVDVIVDLPVVATVDLRRDDVVDDWSALTESGLFYVRDAVASASVDLVTRLAAHEAFASDVGALRLAAALLDASPTLAARLDGPLRDVAWPTVQGESMRIAAPSDVPAGRHAYAAYRRDGAASPYDAPAVHLPDGIVGELRARILRALGCELFDVSEAVARLQERRASGDAAPPPSLPGAPEHPSLRATLASLGATAAEGELEIVAGHGVIAVRVDRKGAATSAAVATPYPVRVVFRCDDRDVGRALVEIAAAAEHHLRAIARDIDALPAFVRDALRMLVCADARRGARTPDLDALAVFPDTTGRRIALRVLASAETARVTTDPPPYPPHDGGDPIACLSPAEIDALSGVVRFADVTADLRDELRGAERRAAPEIERVELDAEMRARCIFTFAFRGRAVSGEVGALAPTHAGARGIHVHTTKRPLAVVPDGAGWPVVAVVNDDSVTPTRAFDGLADASDAARIRSSLRSAVMSRATRFLEAPSDALGVVRLPFSFTARSAAGDRVPCLGVFWLDATWPESPEIHVEAVGHVDPFHTPRLPATDEAPSRILPLRGRLYACCDASRLAAVVEDVLAHVAKRLAAHVAAAGRATHPPSAETLAAYTWDLRLSGLLRDADPIAELARDRPDPVLVRVAVRRAPHLLGVAPPAEVVAAEAAADASLASPPPRASDDAAPPGFFQGLVRRLVELVSPASPPAETALTRALASAIAAMKLTGDPVAAVVETRRGRPVRFDPAGKRLLVNTAHASLRALEAHPSRVLLLVAAAVSEVNRELLPVTDAEELGVIRDLLRDRGEA